MRSVSLTVVSIVLFAFASHSVSALPVTSSRLADGNVDAAAIDGVSSIHKRGGGVGLPLGIVEGVPVVGGLVAGLTNGGKKGGAQKAGAEKEGAQPAGSGAPAAGEAAAES